MSNYWRSDNIPWDLVKICPQNKFYYNRFIRLGCRTLQRRLTDVFPKIPFLDLNGYIRKKLNIDILKHNFLDTTYLWKKKLHMWHFMCYSVLKKKKKSLLPTIQKLRLICRKKYIINEEPIVLVDFQKIEILCFSVNL